MNSKWYVAQVLTGKEYEVCLHLSSIDCRAISPMKIIDERRHGEWRMVRRNIFPGYVFLECEMSDRMYRRIKGTPRVLRILGAGMGQPLPDEEAAAMLIFENEGRDFGKSKLVKKGEEYEVISGPLKELITRVTYVDQRQRRAEIIVYLPDEHIRVSVGVEIVEATEPATEPKTETVKKQPKGARS